jgi:exodeoxyribonuclease-5
MKLSDEQKSVIRNLIKFPKQVQTLGGFAGTGKSTVIRNLMEILPNFAVCAYTGKAANVLRKKGVPATTIHSLIYKAHKLDDKVYFSLASSIPYEGVIVDESSMVSKQIFDDLIYFNKPVVFVGDHGQLEPISEQSFNLMSCPDYKLETIHRNAGEIAHFCEYIRNGYSPRSWQHRYPCEKIKFVSKNEINDLVENVDQIICAYNKKRVEINKLVREKMGKDPNVPTISDKVMCLRNNNTKGLFNGMQGHIGWFHKKNYITFVADGFAIDINIDLNSFNKEKYTIEYDKDAPNPFDYSYCVTCHKCQGSEYDKVLVLEQKSSLWDNLRWNYTAASRAKEKLYWCN